MRRKAFCFRRSGGTRCWDNKRDAVLWSRDPRDAMAPVVVVVPPLVRLLVFARRRKRVRRSEVRFAAALRGLGNGRHQHGLLPSPVPRDAALPIAQR